MNLAASLPLLALLTAPGSLAAQPPQRSSFSQIVSTVISRPEFRRALFGLEVYSLDQQAPLFVLNADKVFTPGSTTKLLTEGTALALLGRDYRFHTPVYRTGPVEQNGTLKGDLVVVASGDPNLSDRLQPDGTLAFADEDHSYGGPKSRLIPGDPLIVMRTLAAQIAASGVRHVTGHVLIDASLFSEGKRELGTGVVISPIALNDNVIDVVATPGDVIGAPAKLVISPDVSYVHFTNAVVTASGADTSFEADQTLDNADGTQTVTLKGDIGLTSGPVVYGYPVTSPSRFAATSLTLALQEKGVVVDGEPGVLTDVVAVNTFYHTQFKLAEHVSAPLSQEVKVTLKVSQNLHASMTPYLLGAVLGAAKDKADEKGFAIEGAFLKSAHLDLSGASQSDGAGGSAAAYYTPDFMVHYLAYMASRPDFKVFETALPVLGRDGTLVNIQPASTAAGHVFAKTGTFDSRDLLNGRAMLIGKGLAGYMTTPSGAHLAFAFYVNHVELRDEADVSDLAGQTLGELAAAAYQASFDRPKP